MALMIMVVALPRLTGLALAGPRILNRTGIIMTGDSMRLKGKRVFITAAGQGIGRASAEACIREGASVVATDRDAGLLEGLDCETAALDAMDGAAVAEMVPAAKPDVLFNCAGFVHAGTILEATDEDFDFAFNLNVRAMFKTMQAAIPGMLERGGGSIINMASAASSIMGAPNRFIYGASKAAVISPGLLHLLTCLRANRIADAQDVVSNSSS